MHFQTVEGVGHTGVDTGPHETSSLDRGRWNRGPRTFRGRGFGERGRIGARGRGIRGRGDFGARGGFRGRSDFRGRARGFYAGRGQ